MWAVLAWVNAHTGWVCLDVLYTEPLARAYADEIKRRNPDWDVRVFWEQRADN